MQHGTNVPQKVTGKFSCAFDFTGTAKSPSPVSASLCICDDNRKNSNLLVSRIEKLEEQLEAVKDKTEKVQNVRMKETKQLTSEDQFGLDIESSNKVAC